MAITTQEVSAHEIAAQRITPQGLAPQRVTRAAPARGRAADLRRRKAGEFWFYFIVTYPLFLAVAVASRLLPMSWRPFPRDAGAPRRSVFGDAKAAAYTMLPFVFMA